jgi:hypothetical protein
MEEVHVNKIISVIAATLVAMSFTAVVFAADTDKRIIIAEPAAGTSPAVDAKKDAAAVKAEATTLQEKEQAEAKKAKAKVKADAKKAKAKVKADAKAAKAKAAADAKAEKELAPVTK